MQEKIYGIHSVLSALERNEQEIKVIYVQKNRTDRRFVEIKSIAKEKKVFTKSLSTMEISRIIGSENSVHQGVCAIMNSVDSKTNLSSIIKKRKEKLVILILERIQDPRNLGACIRSANGMGADAIIITDKCTVKDTETVKKVSSGTYEKTPIFRISNLHRVLKILKILGVLILGASVKSSNSLFDFKKRGAIAVIAGNEQNGIRSLTKRHCDQILSIPMYGDTDSLNVSVSVGIFLYEICKRSRLS